MMGTVTPVFGWAVTRLPIILPTKSPESNLTMQVDIEVVFRIKKRKALSSKTRPCQKEIDINTYEDSLLS